MIDPPTTAWKFTHDDGRFVMRHPERTSYLYFPLANAAGMKCAVTPDLRGDAKVDQDTFLLVPASVEDLHHGAYGRNFWLRMSDGAVWSVAGCSAAQRAGRSTPDADEVSLEAGLLWHRVTRVNERMGLRADVTSFVPAGGGHLELMRIELTNTGSAPKTLTPTAAVPIFGRGADQLRDHRHVTSLLHRIETTEDGVVVRPTMQFDERGHRRNETAYAVYGAGVDDRPPIGFFPMVRDFVGEGGSLDWPEAVVANRAPVAAAGDRLAGGEAVGALRFASVRLDPGDSATYRLVLAVGDQAAQAAAIAHLSADRFDAAFDETVTAWTEQAEQLTVATGQTEFDRWFRWVAIQPVLRRIYGCSFLPYHDYGRGGRGWRDLWQDCLALLLMEPDGVRAQLLSHFAGVRLDGSNATIIGNTPGSFMADRNRIARVWMDHGAWPWVTIKLYLDWTGDLDFLFEPQAYFRDGHVARCRAVDATFAEGSPTVHLDRDGAAYQGTILEHLLVQHLTAFFNVGEHNHLRLEDADWNDGLDLASQRGESVAFSALYGLNLQQLAETLEAVAARRGMDRVELAEECVALLDTLAGGIDYASVKAKDDLLQAYLGSVAPVVSGRRVEVSVEALVADLRAKAAWMLEHIRTHEWIESKDGSAWFNGYYDDDGQRLEGDHASGVRMTLTGQVFAVLSGAATEEQVDAANAGVDRYLWDDAVGGCRLNTDFGDVLMNMGRCYGFAYGEKENGAMFCHMAVMYAYALYARGRARAGWRILDTIFKQSMEFSKSRMYPGIPEYFDPRGRGMYPYLTGSASWYLLTMLTQAFGVRGDFGDLVLAPALVSGQFDAAGAAQVCARFAGRRLRIAYRRAPSAGEDACTIRRITCAGQDLPWEKSNGGAVIARCELEALGADRLHQIDVELA